MKFGFIKWSELHAIQKVTDKIENLYEMVADMMVGE
jgi:hypothetical protein